MLNYIAKVFLEFGHHIIIIPLLIIGFTWLNRKIFHHAILITLFGVLFNYSLKISFQIYSPVYGLIFPSGHMLACTMLYGWIALNSNNLAYRMLTLLLLSGLGSSLVYFGYHNYFDVLGGVFLQLFF